MIQTRGPVSRRIERTRGEDPEILAREDVRVAKVGQRVEHVLQLQRDAVEARRWDQIAGEGRIAGKRIFNYCGGQEC